MSDLFFRAGAVAMLIGADAPLVVENEFRSSHFEHAYDFYKPNLSSPYPVVDGHYSNLCYLKSLDACYQLFVKKFQAKVCTTGSPLVFETNSVSDVQKGVEFDLDAADFVLFHAPYNKLVQKSFARLLYNDFVRFPERLEFAEAKASFGHLSVQESLESGALIKAFSKLGKQRYRHPIEHIFILLTGIQIRGQSKLRHVRGQAAGEHVHGLSLRRPCVAGLQS